MPEAVSDAAMRPRVLFVIGGEHIGGSELHLLRLLPYLEGDFRIGICCINGGTRFLDHLRLSAVETFNLGIPDLRSASRVMKLKDLRRVVRRFEPDIIHCTDIPPMYPRRSFHWNVVERVSLALGEGRTQRGDTNSCGA